MRAAKKLLCLCVVLTAGVAGAQTSPNPTEDPELKKISAWTQQVLQEANKYREDGLRPGAPDDPALKWARQFWKYREEHPGTPAAAAATRMAFGWLRHTDQDKEVIERAEKLPAADPAWDRVIAHFLASAGKIGAHRRFIQKAESLLPHLTDKNLRATVRMALGQAYLRQEQREQAKTVFQAVIYESPGLPQAEDAKVSLYEITSLNPGQSAPRFQATTLDGKTISLEDLGGKVVLLNFWASW